MSKNFNLQDLDFSNQLKSLRVAHNEIIVGTLALTKDNLVAFEYDGQWLINGFAISPLSLPLEKGVFVPRPLPLEGLFGIFDDSLPDGWGRLLLDRMLLKQGINPHTITPITRLAIVGKSAMGALTYEPEIEWHSSQHLMDLDMLAAECAKILASEYPENLDELFALGGSSGGARPKILTSYNNEDWIIKFHATMDTSDAGAMEYDYAIAALSCGIEMPEVALFPSKTTAGYFGVKRFDRKQDTPDNIQRIHVASASALLETSHRIPNLDYATLMQLTLKLTNSFEEMQKLYRLMCFNVFAHNQDDHSKNFAFLYNQDTRAWQLAPAYDLTYSIGMNGEHATTVSGKGRNITMDDLVKLGEKAGLSKKLCRSIASDIQEKTQVLTKWMR